MKKILFIWALALLLITQNNAYSSTYSKDTDGDGYISTEEIIAYFKIRFKELDTDENAGISAEEYLSAYSSIGNRYYIEGFQNLIIQLDRNEDGTVGLREFVFDHMKHYKNADFNNDGRISVMEANNL